MYAYLDLLQDNTKEQAKEIGEAYKECVKKHTHIDTGNLISSYQVQWLGDNTVTVSTDVEYAFQCEYTYQHYMFNKGMHDLINSGIIEEILGKNAGIRYDLGTSHGYGISTQGGLRDANTINKKTS